MFIRVVHHWCKPGQVENGRAFMASMGRALGKVDGFVRRWEMTSLDDPEKLTTLTAWRDREAFETYRRSRPPSDHSNPSNPFTKTAQELYDLPDESA